jgi:hypothetical protein
MVLTRAQGSDLLKDVLYNVLDRDHSSDLWQALLECGIETIFDLLSLDDAGIGDLCFSNFICKSNYLHMGDKLLLTTFLKFLYSKSTSSGIQPSNESFWTLITKADFDEFRSTLPNFVPIIVPVCTNCQAAASLPTAAASVPAAGGSVPTFAAPVPPVAAPVFLATASEATAAVVSPCKPKFQPLLPHEVKQEEIEGPVVAVNVETDAKLDEEPINYGEPVVHNVAKSQATLKSVPKVKGTKVACKAKWKPQLYKGSKLQSKSSAFNWYKQVPPAISASMHGEPYEDLPVDELAQALEFWSILESWPFWKGGTTETIPL